MLKHLVLSFTFAVSHLSAAMILGFGAEADFYSPTADGNFNYKSVSTLFDGDRESTYLLGMYLEHPIPVLPNIRLDYTPETRFQGAGNKIALTQLDVTPYYEIFDNVVDIDVGVSFKVLDVKITGNANETFTEVIPMGYVGAAVSIPGMPIGFSGSVKYIEYDGDHFNDSRIKATWNIAAGLQAQVGYRYESLKVKNRFDTSADMTLEGPFVGLGYIF